MKILVSILSYKGGLDRICSCICTWLRDLDNPHDYIIYGDDFIESTFKKSINVVNGNFRDIRINLPLKTLNMLEHVIQDSSWDFLYKCDDDTFLNFENLKKLLKNQDPTKDLYMGERIYLGKREVVEYAQGGAGYVLSRSAVEKCLPYLREIAPNRRLNFDAEDYSIGKSLSLGGVELEHSPLFYSGIDPGNRRYRKEALVECENKIAQGFISAHYVRPDWMKILMDTKKPSI